MLNGSKFLLLTALVWFCSSLPAMAAAEVTLTVKNPDPYTGNQSWFVYNRNPGDTIEDIAVVKNFGDEPALVQIYPVDAAASPSGSFILKFAHEDQNGIGDWTTVDKKELLIQPDERIDLPFKITIPKELSPGTYIGGIVIEYGPNAPQGQSPACTPKDTCGQSSVSVKTRIGSRIYLTIPGQAMENVDLTDFSYFTSITGQPRFKFTIVNSGNVVYQPQADITVRDSAGNIYDSFVKPLGTSMPKSTIEPVITWDKARPLLANFTATATVTFPKRFLVAGEQQLHGAAVTKTTSFLIIPWDYIFYASLLALIAFSLYALSSIRMKKALAGCEDYMVKENDNLISIAADKKISWRKLAKINKLKPPYILKIGTTIHVPGPTKK